MNITLTYQELKEELKAAAKIIKERFDPTHILAVANGGLIPASFLAKELKVYHMDILGVKSYDNKTQNNIEEYHTPDRVYNSTDRILVVDDIFDTGKTLEYTMQKLLNQGVGLDQIKMYTLFTKSIECDSLIYNFDISKIKKVWIIFPWED